MGSCRRLLLAASQAWPLNVAVEEPTVTGRVIGAWPSFALIGSYELLMRQIRAVTSRTPSRQRLAASPGASAAASPRTALGRRTAVRRPGDADHGLRRQAWSGRWRIGLTTAA